MSIVCFANNKGGVGKTTTALNIGAGMVLRGKKVLLVDYDAQANLTSGLGFPKDTFEFSIHDVINKRVNAEEAILKTKGGIHLIPASKKLRAVDNDFAGDPEAYYYLQDPLDRLRDDYDYIFIDCPPQIGYLTYSAIVATDEVYVPGNPEFFTLEGLNELQEATDKISSRINPNASITGIVVTMHNESIRIHRAVFNQFVKGYGDRVFKTHIRRNIKLTESQSSGIPIFEYDSKSSGAEDYGNLCDEILEREHNV